MIYRSTNLIYIRHVRVQIFEETTYPYVRVMLYPYPYLCFLDHNHLCYKEKRVGKAIA